MLLLIDAIKESVYIKNVLYFINNQFTRLQINKIDELTFPSFLKLFQVYKKLNQ